MDKKKDTFYRYHICLIVCFNTLFYVFLNLMIVPFILLSKQSIAHSV